MTNLTSQNQDFKFYCSVCQLKLSIEERFKGQIISCPKCKLDFKAPRPSYPAGTYIGDFRIDALIGSGSMAEVYSAYHKLMDRWVAIKIIKQKKLDLEERLRFQREIQCLSRFHHPHFVGVVYAGEYHEDYFLAMDLIKGKTCKELSVIEGPFKVKRSLIYCLQIAEAMKYAWNQLQLLHRDIKPSNIMVDTEKDIALLTDLGISKSLAVESDLTKNDMVLGSPYYMSPEQAANKNLDLRSDIYALGATLYHFLSGTPPFDGQSPMEVLVAKTDTLPSPLKELNPDLPEVIYELVEELMQFQRDDRPDTWDKVIDLLKSARMKTADHSKRPTYKKSKTSGATLKISMSTGKHRSTKRKKKNIEPEEELEEQVKADEEASPKETQKTKTKSPFSIFKKRN